MLSWKLGGASSSGPSVEVDGPMRGSVAWSAFLPSVAMIMESLVQCREGDRNVVVHNVAAVVHAAVQPHQPAPQCLLYIEIIREGRHRRLQISDTLKLLNTVYNMQSYARNIQVCIPAKL